ncbi:MAG: c-type cytochrome [Thermoleophilaceae bacterium]
MPRPWTSPAPRAVAALGALALMASGCGGELDVQKADRGTGTLFNERCSGCHSLDSANSYGSKPVGELAGGERTNGPNFNVRKVSRDDALYAIRNGGFSGAIMPANIVVGEDAERLAEFIAEYSGKDSSSNTDTANPSSNE